LSVEQSAIYANRSVDTIRQWIKRNLIDTERDEFGWRIMIKREDIDERINEIEQGINRKKPRGKYNKTTVSQ